MNLSKWAGTLASRKFVIAIASAAFLALNAHFGWMSTETAFYIITPFLVWAGIEGFIDAKKPFNMLDLVRKIPVLLGNPEKPEPDVLNRVPKDLFVRAAVLKGKDLEAFRDDVLLLAEQVQNRILDQEGKE